MELGAVARTVGQKNSPQRGFVRAEGAILPDVRGAQGMGGEGGVAGQKSGNFSDRCG